MKHLSDWIVLGIGVISLLGAIVAHVLRNDRLFVAFAIVQIGVAVFNAANINAKR